MNRSVFASAVTLLFCSVTLSSAFDQVKAVAAKLLSAKPAVMVVGPALSDEGNNGGKG